jgi:hypothetical protein
MSLSDRMTFWICPIFDEQASWQEPFLTLWENETSAYRAADLLSTRCVLSPLVYVVNSEYVVDPNAPVERRYTFNLTRLPKHQDSSLSAMQATSQ